MRRRYTLLTLVRIGALALIGSSTPPAAYAATVIASTYGVSRQQRPLVDYRIADAPKKVLIVGGIHAGAEANTVSLVQDLFTAAQSDPSIAPSGLSLTF